MHYRNESVVPDEFLMPLNRWAAHQAWVAAKLSYIHYTNGKDPEGASCCVVTGDAFPGGGWLLGYTERHRIEIHVPPNLMSRTYPRTFAPPGPNMPAVTYGSWKDEIAHTLLHELRHVEQFEAGNLPGTWPVQAAEIDAEVFAGKLLPRFCVWRTRYLHPIVVRAMERAAS